VGGGGQVRARERAAVRLFKFRQACALVTSNSGMRFS
jgi:hypothetical protein